MYFRRTENNYESCASWISAHRSGRYHAPDRLANCTGTGLSIASGDHHRSFRRRGADRYLRAPHRQLYGGTLGQQVVIENAGGAGGIIGSTRATRAAPDGYTVSLGHNGTHAVAVSLYPKLAYRPDRDFEPIGLIVETHGLIVARKDFPAEHLEEFTAYVKANGPKLNMAHGGVGSNSFIRGLLFNSSLGVRPTYVPFSGNGPATAALLAGQVDYMFPGIAEVGSQIESGLLKAYAISAPKRHAVLPNIPTTAEAGLPGFVDAVWFALFAPKDTPEPIVAKLSSALEKALDDEKVRARFTELGGSIPDKAQRGPQSLAARVKTEMDRWALIIRAANIKTD